MHETTIRLDVSLEKIYLRSCKTGGNGRSRGLSASGGSRVFHDGSRCRAQRFEGELGAIHPGLRPEPGDIVVVKHRISAFAGTDLPIILRAQEIDTLILFGIATSGVVLSTLTDLHRTLLHSLFPQRASVMTSAGFVATRQ